MSQNHASCRLDDPEIIWKLENPRLQIQNLKSKIEMTPVRLERTTSGLEDLRSNSIELRSRKNGGDERIWTSNLLIRSELLWFRWATPPNLNFRFGISDFGLEKGEP